MTMVMFVFAGVFSGLIAALFGLGGGVLMVPVLFWALQWLHIPSHVLMHVAVATSLAVMVVTSLRSSYGHYKKRHVSVRVVQSMTIPLILGAAIGAAASHWIHSNSLRYLFVAYLVCNLLYAFFKKDFTQCYERSDFRMIRKRFSFPICLVTGFISVLLGSGGGTVLMPLLRKARMPMVRAAGTSNALTVCVAVVGAVAYGIVGSHVSGLPPHCIGYIYWPAFLGLSIGTLFGIPLGTYCSAKLPDALSAKLYMVVLVFVVVLMLV
jgi:uncharacterized membrane protein YfcA